MIWEVGAGLFLKKAEFISFKLDLTIILAIINFLVFVALMRHFFFDKIKAVLEERRQLIEADMLAAKRDKEEAKQLKAHYSRKMAKADDEGDLLLNQRVQQGKERASEIVKEANEEAMRIKTRAKREIEREQIKAKDELKKEVGDLVIATTSALLQKQVSKEDHQELIMESIQEIGDHTWQN